MKRNGMTKQQMASIIRSIRGKGLEKELSEEQRQSLLMSLMDDLANIEFIIGMIAPEQIKILDKNGDAPIWSNEDGKVKFHFSFLK